MQSYRSSSSLIIVSFDFLSELYIHRCRSHRPSVISHRCDSHRSFFLFSRRLAVTTATCWAAVLSASPSLLGRMHQESLLLVKPTHPPSSFPHLLQLLLQLHCKVVGRVIIVPALLPEMCVASLLANLVLLCPIYQRWSALVARHFSLRSSRPSTGKSSNSSSSSSCAALFCG